MMEAETTDKDLQDTVCGLLERINQGDEDARSALFEALYPALRRNAQAKMRDQPLSHTLQATALVGEVFLKLVRPSNQGYRDRDHFLSAASRAMRHVLVDHARKQSAQKRSGQREALELDECAAPDDGMDLPIADLEEALVKLEAIDPKMARAVEMRFFAGASAAEAARVLDIAPRTFTARWAATSEWLRNKLGEV